MADTGVPWSIKYPGVGENPHPLNKTMEEMADSVHAALEGLGGGSAYQSLPAVTGWTQSGVYAKIGKLIIAHFQWSRTGGTITDTPLNLGTLAVGTRPAAAVVRAILYNSNIGAGGIQPRLSIAQSGDMTTSNVTISNGNSLTGGLVWVAA